MEDDPGLVPVLTAREIVPFRATLGSVYTLKDGSSSRLVQAAVERLPRAAAPSICLADRVLAGRAACGCGYASTAVDQRTSPSVAGHPLGRGRGRGRGSSVALSRHSAANSGSERAGESDRDPSTRPGVPLGAEPRGRSPDNSSPAEIDRVWRWRWLSSVFGNGLLEGALPEAVCSTRYRRGLQQATTSPHLRGRLGRCSARCSRAG